MTFPAYPESKASGVEWLGEIPAGWTVKRLKDCFELRTSNVDKVSQDEEEPVRLCNYTDVYYRDVISSDAGLMRATARQDEIERFTLRGGDVLITKDSETADDIAVPALVQRDLPGVLCGYHLAMLRSRGRDDGSFLRYWFLSNYARALFEVSAKGLTRVGLSQSSINDAPVAFPPVKEQSAIAAFLDRETAKIDAAVAAQERLIALLAEKRAATISYAVTKGLDPDAPMKDSGIEWLGQIPAHWGAGKLGYGARLQGGFAFASGDFQSEGIPVVKMNNLSRGSLKLHNAVRVDEAVAVEAFALAAGDIVWGMSGSIGATGSLGNFAVVEEGDLPCQLNQRVGRFEIRSRKVDTNFLKLWIQSDEFYRQVELAVTGTAQYNISSEQVEATAMCFPPLAEQRTIADAVLAKLSSHSKIVERAGEQITLLRERRAALISAAVTGKIDVRGEVEPEEQEAA